MPGGYPANYWSFGRNLVNGVPVPVAAGAHPAALHDHRGRAEAVRHRQHDGLQSVDRLDVRSVHERTVQRRSAFRRPAARTRCASSSAPITPAKRARTRCRTSSSTASRRFATARARRARRFVRTSCTRRRCAATSRSRSRRTRRSTSTSGYQDRDLWTPFDGTFFAGLSNQLFSAPGYLTPTNGTAREYVGDISWRDSAHDARALHRLGARSTGRRSLAPAHRGRRRRQRERQQLPGSAARSGHDERLGVGPDVVAGLLGHRHLPHELAAVHGDGPRPGHAAAVRTRSRR